MDLSKLPNPQKLNLCRRFFRIGFAFLPLAWAINAVWFYPDAFQKPTYDEQKQMKKYVIYSLIGALIWSIIIAIWVTTFQMNRDAWGATADYLSFIVPAGDPRNS